jgi:DNA-binding response OmpR family regulator
MSTALLLAEPEPAYRGVLERHLRSDGFDVLEADPAADLLALAERSRPDLVLVPSVELCDRLRSGAAGSTLDRAVPVILLGREDADEHDRVRALQRGADDYVQHPCVYAELVERIRAVLRRVAPPVPPVVEAGEIRLDRGARLVSVNGRRIRLATKEYALLDRLASGPTRVFTKDELLREVWGIDREDVRTKTLESHASRLRRKLREHAARDYVVNVWGIGYRLLDGLAAQEATHERVDAAAGRSDAQARGCGEHVHRGLAR